MGFNSAFKELMKLFLDRFSKYTQISNFKKIRLAEAELCHADGRTDGRTDMTKLMVAFRNFANAPKKKNSLAHTMYVFVCFIRFSAQTDYFPQAHQPFKAHSLLPRSSLSSFVFRVFLVSKPGRLCIVRQFKGLGVWSYGTTAQLPGINNELILIV